MNLPFPRSILLRETEFLTDLRAFARRSLPVIERIGISPLLEFKFFNLVRIDLPPNWSDRFPPRYSPESQEDSRLLAEYFHSIRFPRRRTALIKLFLQQLISPTLQDTVAED